VHSFAGIGYSRMEERKGPSKPVPVDCEAYGEEDPLRQVYCREFNILKDFRQFFCNPYKTLYIQKHVSSL
jgi:hypothetical protein